MVGCDAGTPLENAGPSESCTPLGLFGVAGAESMSPSPQGM